MYMSGFPETGSLSERESLLVPHLTRTVPDVQFLDLYDGKIFYKKQYRKNHMTRQLVKDGGHGLIRMTATTNGQLLRILGWVKRDDEAARLTGDGNGEVPIKKEETGEIKNLIKSTDVPTVTEDGYPLQPFAVDLHEIYLGNPGHKPVFELCKSDAGNKKNVFQLVIQLEYIDTTKSEKFYSPRFILRTEETGKKRRRIDDNLNSSMSVSASQSSPVGSVASMDSGMYESTRQQQILVDMLDAKTAKIGKLVAQDCEFGTKRADLAYHMRLLDPNEFTDLEEGDIVGFYEDEFGDTYIQRLRSDNIHTALHAGVVSRSYWLAGNSPQNAETKTDTICVIGIVNVKIVGSVENGERIYASRDSPGKAIPQSHMPVGSFLRKKHVLLGMALETKKCCKRLDDVNLVKSFVCIVLDVSRKELLEEIEDLYEINEKRTEEQIKIANKKNWRRLKGCFFSSLILVGVIIFILYQLLVSGSMFRYWFCRLGSIPDHHLNFVYFNEKHKRIDVHGIQFTLERLRDKVGSYFPRNDKNSTMFYYLNVDGCAYYWHYGATGNNIGGRKNIGGSKIFSVNSNCSVVYEFLDETMDWVLVENQRNITCTRPR